MWGMTVNTMEQMLHRHSPELLQCKNLKEWNVSQCYICEMANNSKKDFVTNIFSQHI